MKIGRQLTVRFLPNFNTDLAPCSGPSTDTVAGWETILSRRQCHRKLLAWRQIQVPPRASQETPAHTQGGYSDSMASLKHGTASQARRSTARVSQISKQQGVAKRFPGALSRRYLGACLRRPGTSKIYHRPISKSRQSGSNSSSIRFFVVSATWSASPTAAVNSHLMTVLPPTRCHG